MTVTHLPLRRRGCRLPTINPAGGPSEIAFGGIIAREVDSGVESGLRIRESEPRTARIERRTTLPNAGGVYGIAQRSGGLGTRGSTGTASALRKGYSAETVKVNTLAFFGAVAFVACSATILVRSRRTRSGKSIGLGDSGRLKLVVAREIKGRHALRRLGQIAGIRGSDAGRLIERNAAEALIAIRRYAVEGGVISAQAMVM